MIFFTFKVYVGKVEVPRHKLSSFLRSAQILSIKGLSHVQTKTKKKSFCNNSPAENQMVGRDKENNESQEPTNDDEESNLKRPSNHLSDLGGPKRPRLIPRPPPKPVTTTITPGNLLIVIFMAVLKLTTKFIRLNLKND